MKAGVSGGAENGPRRMSSQVCWFVKLIDLRIWIADGLKGFFILQNVSFEPTDEGEVT